MGSFAYQNIVGSTKKPKKSKAKVHRVAIATAKSNKPNINGNEPHFTLVKRTDEAMLNSVLSYAVYDSNSWMMENLTTSIEKIASVVKDLVMDKTKRYDLKVWLFMKNTFEKIPDSELNIPYEGVSINDYNYETHFKFKDGQYSTANGLAHACVLKSKHPDRNGDILHLSFRGTEGSRLLEYFKGPYLDMTAYYQHFKPFVEYVQEYVNNPNNNITELHVNGHSLGGAMVQEFLKDNPSDNFEVPVKGFTFGSPGSEKRLYNKFLTLAHHALGRKIRVPINPYSVSSSRESRITQFYHKNDPIPLFGLLAYTKGSSTYNLADISYNESKEANLEQQGVLEKIPAFGKLITYFKEIVLNKTNFKFHDCARYIMNLRNNIDEYYEAYPQNSTVTANTKFYQQWIEQEKKIPLVSTRSRQQFESLIKEIEPTLKPMDIQVKTRELIRDIIYDSKAEFLIQQKYIDATEPSNSIQMELSEDDHKSLSQPRTNKNIIPSSQTVIERIKNLQDKYEDKELREIIGKRIS